MSKTSLTPAEQEYEDILAKAVLKDQHQAPSSYDANGKRRKWMYTVTTKARSKLYGGDRTVIIMSSFREADKLLRENGEFFWEFSYNLAVIEAVAVNCVYGFPSGQGKRPAFWYRWVSKGNSLEEGTGEGSYHPIETPKVFQKMYGWGIG